MSHDRRPERASLPAIAAIACALIYGCAQGTEDNGAGASAGSGGSSGAVSTGGAAGTAGLAGGGGAQAGGGGSMPAGSDGGPAGAGGALTGGAAGSGQGGVDAGTGGAPTGGAAGTSTGGAAGNGGTSTGGTGGTSTGGAAGKGGSAGTGGAAGKAGSAGTAGAGGTGGAGCHPVINELMAGTNQSASDEFIEIFNPCSAAIDLTGWKIIYRAAAGTSDVTLYTWASGSVAANKYVLLVGSAYSGTPAADGDLANGLAKAGGGVALRDSSSTNVDSVGYGTATNAFIEGTVAPVPPAADTPGNSIARTPNGKDTDDNSADFLVATAPTPKAAN